MILERSGQRQGELADRRAHVIHAPQDSPVPIPILLDCDPGHDDAIALLLALASPGLELLGVTTTYGDQTPASRFRACPS